MMEIILKVEPMGSAIHTLDVLAEIRKKIGEIYLLGYGEGREAGMKSYEL